MTLDRRALDIYRALDVEAELIPTGSPTEPS
jgi:hypothetical protein